MTDVPQEHIDAARAAAEQFIKATKDVPIDLGITYPEGTSIDETHVDSEFLEGLMRGDHLTEDFLKHAK